MKAIIKTGWILVACVVQLSLHAGDRRLAQTAMPQDPSQSRSRFDMQDLSGKSVSYLIQKLDECGCGSALFGVERGIKEDMIGWARYEEETEKSVWDRPARGWIMAVLQVALYQKFSEDAAYQAKWVAINRYQRITAILNAVRQYKKDPYPLEQIGQLIDVLQPGDITAANSDELWSLLCMIDHTDLIHYAVARRLEITWFGQDGGGSARRAAKDRGKEHLVALFDALQDARK